MENLFDQLNLKELNTKSKYYVALIVVFLLAASFLGGIYSLLIPLITTLIVVIFILFRRINCEVKKILKAFCVSIPIAFLIILSFTFLVVPFVELFFNDIENNSSIPHILNPDGGSLFIFFSLVLTIANEFFYRGFLIHNLSRLMGGRYESWFIATIISSVLYGAMWLQFGASEFVMALLLGLLLAYIYMIQRNLWTLMFIQSWLIIYEFFF